MMAETQLTQEQKDGRQLMGYKEWANTNHTPEIPDIVESLLPDDPGAFMLLTGRSGLGKTNMALHLAFCIATGTPFYGLKCQAKVVGYLALEGSSHNLKDRLHKVEQHFPETDNLRFELRQPFLLEKHIEEFKSIFAGCQVNILDNLRQVTTSQYLKPEYAANTIRLYSTALREMGQVGVLTHHIRKPSGNPQFIDYGDIYNIKGASEYVEEATTALLLEKAKQRHNSRGKFIKANPNEAILYFGKHRVAEKEIPAELTLTYIYDRCEWCEVGDAILEP